MKLGKSTLSKKTALDAANLPAQFLEQNRRVFSTPTALYVSDLAMREGLRFNPIYGDRWASAVSQLAGDEVKSDATDNLLVALVRSGKMMPELMVQLVIQHHRELKSI